jgi:hypothetical protein
VKWVSKKFTIIRDSKEHEGHGWRWNKSQWCNGSKVEALKTGDYTIEEVPQLIIIERKQNFNELCSNFISHRDRLKRLFERMTSYRYRYLIIECELSDILNKWNYQYLPAKIRGRAPSIILGSLVSAGLRYGIQVIFAGQNGKEYATRVMRKAYSYYLAEQKDAAK